MGGRLVDCGLQEDMLLLDAAVNDAYGRRVIGRREQLEVGRDGNLYRLDPLRQFDVLRFDHFKEVRVVENKVAKSLPHDLNPQAETVARPHGIDGLVVYAIEDAARVKA